MWKKPWSMKVGFLIGGGLICAGLLLQVLLGPVNWTRLAWPVNLIVLILLLAAVGILYALRKEVYAFEWMMHAGAAVPCLIYAASLTMLMGLLPQVREGGMPWLSQMLSFWPFVLIWSWMMRSLSTSSIRAFPRKRRMISWRLRIQRNTSTP